MTTYLVARLLPAGATMLLTLVCIETMAPQEYARYSVTMLAVAVAAGFAGGISGQPMLRFGRDLSADALRRGLWQLPSVAALVLSPVLLAYLGFAAGWSWSLMLALAMMPLLSVMDARRSLFVAFGAARSVLALDVLRSLVALVGVAWLLQAWAATTGVAVLVQLFAVAVALLLVRPRPEHVQGRGNRSVDRAYLGFGLGIAGWLAAILGLSLVERGAVAAMAGAEAAGGYAAQADVIHAVFAATGGALGSALMPSYLDQAQHPDARAWRRLTITWQVGMLSVALFCVLVGVALASLGWGQTSAALTGDVPTGLLLVVASAVWTAGGFVQKPLELRSQTHLIFLGAVAALLLFAALVVPMSAAWGTAGVALAKLCAGVGFCAWAHGWGRVRA